MHPTQALQEAHSEALIAAITTNTPQPVRITLDNATQLLQHIEQLSTRNQTLGSRHAAAADALDRITTHIRNHLPEHHDTITNLITTNPQLSD